MCMRKNAEHPGCCAQDGLRRSFPAPSLERTVRRPSGFTLIELLVVIAIISLLVSILLPSLQRARDLAKNVLCKAGSKSQGTAFCMYGEDYDTYIPRAGYYSDWGWTDTNWDGALFPYLGIPAGEYKDPNTVFTCPSDEVTRITPNPQGYVIRSYLINDVPEIDLRFTNNIYCPAGKKGTEIERPSELILVVCQPTFGGFIGRNRWVCMSFYGQLGQIPGTTNPASYPFLQNHTPESTNFIHCDSSVQSRPWWETANPYYGGAAPNSDLWFPYK